MAQTQSPLDDYTTGQPREHHSLYLEDGTFLMQVCAIHLLLLVDGSPL